VRETDEVQSLRWPAYGWTGLAYVVKGACGNCGRAALVYVQHGHEAPWYHNGPECPCCGRIQWVGWHAPGEEPSAPAGLADKAWEELLDALTCRAWDAYAASLERQTGIAAAQTHTGRRALREATAAIVKAIGGREAALEAVVREAIAHDDYLTQGYDPSAWPVGLAQQAVAAVALTPTDAAEAVRELVDDADHALSVLLAVKAQTPDGPLLVMVDDAIAGMCAALRPFGGAGDADGA
jgi:hypothetical protein